MSKTENRPKLTLREFAELIRNVCKSVRTSNDSHSSSTDLENCQIKPGDIWQDVLQTPVYGRVCTNTTSKLAAAPGRKTAFVFGPETFLSEAFFNKTPYELLLHLGFLPEYIHMKVGPIHFSVGQCLVCHPVNKLINTYSVIRCMGCLRHGTTNRIWPSVASTAAKPRNWAIFDTRVAGRKRSAVC